MTTNELVVAADPAVAQVTAAVVLRPQSVLLTFFGDYVLDGDVLVSAGSVVDVLGRVGIGEHAARATLTRMVHRDLLRREVRGRRAYFGPTEHGRRIILDGRNRVQDGDIVTRQWDGTWTVVGFSMPESWQRERHDLRSRLQWAGFGMVQAGLWVAPRRVDLAAVLEDSQLGEYVHAFEAAPTGPTEPVRLIAEAYDLPPLAARYIDFAARWTPFDGDAPAADPVSRRVVLTTDWLQTVRDDPRLPLEFLPADWPAMHAEVLFRRINARLRRAAEREMRQRLDVIPGAAPESSAPQDA
ncbi:PaaX family transcriptional regulator [Dactylosporangium sp. NBC_01737]|uniref:PaaX family transcriptional regulator n=1 Tax=Dactylosporangium sp. NBC_01737 TaxID=2975959 RepID=UPI002E0ED7F2|nr:PaaX family transcriptional regulator [Dactylosporangium sp. NBC_01737]